jgi:hypothetical protein
LHASHTKQNAKVKAAARLANLAARLSGSPGDLLDDDRILGLARSEKKPVIADAPAEHARPLRALKGLYIALERVGGQSAQGRGPRVSEWPSGGREGLAQRWR